MPSRAAPADPSMSERIGTRVIRPPAAVGSPPRKRDDAPGPASVTSSPRAGGRRIRSAFSSAERSRERAFCRRVTPPRWSPLRAGWRHHRRLPAATASS